MPSKYGFSVPVPVEPKQHPANAELLRIAAEIEGVVADILVDIMSIYDEQGPTTYVEKREGLFSVQWKTSRPAGMHAPSGGTFEVELEMRSKDTIFFQYWSPYLVIRNEQSDNRKILKQLARVLRDHTDITVRVITRVHDRDFGSRFDEDSSLEMKGKRSKRYLRTSNFGSHV